MKRFLYVIIAALIFAATIPTNANAAPRKWQCVRRGEYTYAIGSNFGPKCAALVKAPNRKNVTIPKTVTYKGRTYKVRAVWDGAIRSNVRNIDVRTPYLDTWEDDVIFDSHKVRVTVHDRATYRWLHTWLGKRVTLK